MAANTCRSLAAPTVLDDTILDPLVVSGHMEAVVAVVAPRSLVLQKLGCPSDRIPVAGNGSSVERHRQRQFVEHAIDVLTARAAIRLAASQQLGNRRPAELAILEQFFSLSDAPFLEFPVTLGPRGHFTGAVEPACFESVARMALL